MAVPPCARVECPQTHTALGLSDTVTRVIRAATCGEPIPGRADVSLPAPYQTALEPPVEEGGAR